MTLPFAILHKIREPELYRLQVFQGYFLPMPPYYYGNMEIVMYNVGVNPAILHI